MEEEDRRNKLVGRRVCRYYVLGRSTAGAYYAGTVLGVTPDGEAVRVLYSDGIEGTLDAEDLAECLIHKPDQEEEGWTPLHVAAAYGHAAVAAELLRYCPAEAVTAGADCEAMLEPVLAGNAAAGAAPSWLRDYWLSPLGIAVLLGHLPVVQALLAHGGAGAAANATDTWRKAYELTASPLACAAACDQPLAMVQRLLNAGADMGHATKKGVSALSVAAVKGDISLMRLLLQHGAPVDQPLLPGSVSDYRQGALLLAVAHGHAAAAQLLLERGARPDGDPDDVDVYGYGKTRMCTAPLHAAVESGRVDLASMLLDAGADINLRSEGFCHPTALHLAAGRGDPAMVELLLARGADTTIVSHEHTSWREDEHTAIFYAVEGAASNASRPEARHARCVELLIAAGVGPDDVGDCVDDTPLLGAALLYGRRDAAAQRRLEAVAAVLLRHGADPLHKSAYSGLVPLEMAQGRLQDMLQRKVDASTRAAAAAEKADAARAKREAGELRDLEEEEARLARGAPPRRAAAQGACKKMRAT